MYKIYAVVSTILVCCLLSACANSNYVDHQAKKQFFTKFYAWVENVDKLNFKSYAGEGFAFGAVDGLLNNASGHRQNMFAGSIIGGLFGGLITALLESDNNGYEYQLAAVDGELVSVIVEKTSRPKRTMCKSCG